jgi:hypothetical protein
MISVSSEVLAVPFPQPNQLVSMAVSREKKSLTPVSAAAITGVIAPTGGLTGSFDGNVDLWWFDTFFSCQGTYVWSLGPR